MTGSTRNSSGLGRLDKAGPILEATRRDDKIGTADEEIELAGLCGLAWERREDPEALRAAVAAIEDWFDRRHVRRYERKLRSHAAVLQVLRETQPRPREWVGPEPPTRVSAGEPAA